MIVNTTCRMNAIYTGSALDRHDTSRGPEKLQFFGTLLPRHSHSAVSLQIMFARTTTL